jgi:hypothetical protein
MDSVPEALEKFIYNPSLCNWFRYYSVLTWEKIAFARNGKRLKLNETTVTQNLVFEFWMMAKYSPFPITIYESTNERANGNDLEIFLETPNGYIFIPVQAKIIKKGNKYPTIQHLVRGKQQIDILLEYAKKKKGLAAYLLYNWCYEPGTIRIVESMSGENIEHFGCSIANANAIKKYFYSEVRQKKIFKAPAFGDLHPDLAMPFHFLVGLPFEHWYPFMSDQQKKEEIHFYSREQIEQELGWEDMAPPAKIGYITHPDKELISPSLFEGSAHYFNPKFRIVFSYERKTGALYMNIG